MKNIVDVKQLKANFKNIFKDCLLPNGCLVAAPSHMPYYPKRAKNYLYCWPGRDTGFSLAAMLMIGFDYYEEVLTWIWERAEEFNDALHERSEGLLFRSYHPNGAIREHQFQPDQVGTLLWSIGFKAIENKKKLTDIEFKVVDKVSHNLCRVWNRKAFKLAIEDLWEERGIKAGGGNFTYTLASCISGLNYASIMLSNKELKDTSYQMLTQLKKYCFDCANKTIPRCFSSKLNIDKTVDGSLAGLVWPFNVGFKKDHLLKTVEKQNETLITECGVIRYPEDRYEGSATHNYRNIRAGAWPLLTFWLSIANFRLGNKDKAKELFYSVFDNVKNYKYIPEQVCLRKERWVGVKPLLWAHAKSIFAAKELGLI